MNTLYLAYAYLRYYWARSLVLVVTVALILFVPVATRLLLVASERALNARAEATPLVLGSRGSALDLALAALYFSDERPDPLSQADVETLWDSGLAVPIPLSLDFRTNGARIVGTSLDYFDFRGLTIAQGRPLALLGEAVLGADVAARLDLGPGDTVVSSPENLFDLDGVYPLELSIVGVLDPTNSPDDEAVFVDMKTAWVIAGIGHGHQDVVADTDGGDVVAPAAIVQYQRITPENIDSFHFHGAPDDYPVSAVIVVPNDTRAGTILQGRYLDPDGAQMIVPGEVISGLIDRIFRIRTLLDAVTAIIAVAALAAIGLALFLGYRLRAREVEVAVKLGAPRAAVTRLIAAESVLLLTLSGLIAALAALLLARNAETWAGLLLALGQ